MHFSSCLVQIQTQKYLFSSYGVCNHYPFAHNSCWCMFTTEIYISSKVDRSWPSSPTSSLKYSMAIPIPAETVGPLCGSSESLRQLVDMCLYSASVITDYHWEEPPLGNKASLKVNIQSLLYHHPPCIIIYCSGTKCVL